MKIFVSAIIFFVLLHLPYQSAAQTKSNQPVPSEAEYLCKRIFEIKRMPIKEEKSGDPVHDALIDAGTKAIPCLIQQVSNLKKMQDPRQVPHYLDVRVGDVAYFILVKISKLDFTAMLPQTVRKAYQTDGVYAYFRYVEQSNNRKRLQRTLQRWYQQTYKAGR